MPAPNKIIIRVGGLKLSAFDLGEVKLAGERPIVCKICAPQKTKMRFSAQVSIPSTAGEIQHYVYTCANCGRSWSVCVRQPLAVEVTD
jgi:hypothetical protein